MKLEHKKAIIIGGSRGIGKTIAAEFLRNGAQVFIAARNAEELQSAEKELSSLGTVKTTIVDVSKKEDIDQLANEVRASWGAPDVVVNAAAISGPIGNVTDVNPDEWVKALNVNLIGTFYAVNVLGKDMKANGGSIINFVGGGEGPYVNFSSYITAKGGIARFTETVAMELKEFNIRVNAIAPGAVNTKFLEDLIAAGPEKAGKANYERALKQKESGGVSPEAAAKLCVFLASDDSKKITGKIISAVWDPYDQWDEKVIEELMNSDVFTMRRIRAEDRGFQWGEKSFYEKNL